MDENINTPGQTPNQPETTWIDAQQMMQIFFISPSTLKNWRQNGTVEYSKIGGRILYNKQAAYNQLEARVKNRDKREE